LTTLLASDTAIAAAAQVDAVEERRGEETAVMTTYATIGGWTD